MHQTLSHEYDQAYQAHLVAFRQRLIDTYGQQPFFTDFYPSIGVQKDKPVDLLFYGQSVGGWQTELDYRQEIPARRVEESRDYSNASTDGDSPVNWVNLMWSGNVPDDFREKRAQHAERYGSYSPSRSLFWQVIKHLMHQKFSPSSANWSWADRVVWSNLYKIAPQKGTWHHNPNDEDCVLQRPECVELVKMELLELKPKYCVVLTNDDWWAHFRTGIKTEVIAKPKDSLVVSVERFSETTIVVTKRPFVGSYTKFVGSIVPHLN